MYASTMLNSSFIVPGLGNLSSPSGSPFPQSQRELYSNSEARKGPDLKIAYSTVLTAQCITPCQHSVTYLPGLSHAQMRLWNTCIWIISTQIPHAYTKPPVAIGHISQSQLLPWASTLVEVCLYLGTEQNKVRTHILVSQERKSDSLI